MITKKITKTTVLLLFVGLLSQTTVAKNVFTRRYLRIPAKISDSKKLPETVALMKRAASKGYNGIMIDDSQTFLVYKAPFFEKVKKTLGSIKAEADKLNLHVMMYSHGQTQPSSIDKNTAEAMPVRDTKFIVSGTRAQAVTDHGVKFVNGGIEQYSGNAPLGWKYLKCAAGTHVFVDTQIKKDGNASVRFQNVPAVCGIMQDVAVKPHRAYELSCWVKTEGFSRSTMIGFRVHGSGRWGLLNSRDGDWRYQVQANTNWKRCSVDFNSWDQTKVNIRLQPTNYFTSPGRIWFDDIQIREVGLIERVDRPNLPVTVKAEGGKVYTEGKDYTIGKQVLTIPAGSAIQSGDVLRVSYYQKADMLGHSAASFCYDGTWDIVAMIGRKLDSVLKPRGWFIKYSEWRLGYWDPNCPNAPYHYKTAGEYMGGTQKRTVDILRGVTNNCNLESYIWSDSFDPYHNSKSAGYYLINGSPFQSWKNMDPKTVVLSWNEGKKYESLRFFAGMDPKYRGHKFRTMISCWAESPPDKPGGWLAVINRLEKEGMKDGSVIGMQYTSWYRSNYTRIEAFADACKAAGRWGSGPVPWEPVDPKCQDNGASISVSKSLPSSAGMDLVNAKGMIKVAYSLQGPGRVRLRMTDCAGKRIREVSPGEQKAGMHHLSLNSARLPAGLYFVRLTKSNGAPGITKKVVVF